jgi:hypothetical protein
MANQDDVIETQRQTEALHRVVSRTSEYARLVNWSSPGCQYYLGADTFI